MRAAVESLCGVAWLLIGSPTERLGTRADAAPDARALAEHLLAEVGEERPSAREIPSLIVPLPRDDGRRGFVPEIERLYVWVRAALGTKQAIGDWRQADARALGGARAEARSGLDPQIEA